MKKGTKIFVTISLVFAMIFSVVKLDVIAGSISDAKDKKTALEKKKDDMENTIAKLELKKNSIVEYIGELDKKLASIEDSIEELDYKITTTQINLDKTKVELQKAEAEEAKQYDTMKARIQSMYVNGNSQYLQIVLSSESISDFLNRSEYVKQISNYDKNMFDEYKKVKEDVEAKKSDIEDKLAQLEAMNGELIYNKQTVQRLQRNKQNELAKYNAAINKSSAAVAAYNKAIKDAEDELERLIQEQQRKAAAQNSSYEISANAATGFVWPTPTSYRITCGFGYRSAPTAGASTYHKGIDIGLPTGSPVVATKAGTVVMASYNSAKGYYVVIDHGSGIMSYYYHNSRILVSVGDKVSAGQQVAKAGNTGISTGSHLHFSITINGTYVNPRKYVG